MKVDDQKRKFIKQAHNQILNQERDILKSEMQKLEQKDTLISKTKKEKEPVSFRD